MRSLRLVPGLLLAALAVASLPAFADQEPEAGNPPPISQDHRSLSLVDAETSVGDTNVGLSVGDGSTTAEPITTPVPTTTTPAPTDPPTDPPTTEPLPTTTVPPTDPPTDPPTTQPAPTSTAPPPTSAPPTDPPTTQPAPTSTAPPPTSAPPTDPPTTQPAPTSSEPPPTTAPAPTTLTLPPITITLPPITTAPPPTTAPVTTEPVNPTTAPVTTGPVNPTTAPVTTGPVNPTTAPVTTGPVNPTTAPVTTEPVNPTTAPVTTAPVPTTTPTPTFFNNFTLPPDNSDVTLPPSSNDPTTKTPLTSEPLDDADDAANKPDIILYNSSNPTNKFTESPDVDGDASGANAKTEHPIVLDMRSGGSSATASPKPYVRGDKIDAAADNAASSDAETESKDLPNVIGGRRRNAAVDAGSILTKSSATLHDFVRYAATAFAGISVALLLFFHYVSLDPSLSWSNAVWSPNTWEFLVYGTFLQQMASVSQLTLLKTPYYLFDYADGFAWTNFLIQHGGTKAASASTARRLEDIVLGGVVAYADRLGMNESNVLAQAVIGFVVVFGIMLVLFVVIALIARRKAEQEMGTTAELPNFTQSVHGLRSASIRTLGLCVLIWYFALYPLSLYSSFEISMEFEAKQIATALILALAALGVVCFGVLAWAGRVILQKGKDELLQFEIMATWGSLYAELTFRSRMFFVAGVLVQILTGVIVGAVTSVPTQIVIVIVVEVLYVVAVFITRPFADTLIKVFTYCISAVKIVNYSLCLSFTYSSSLSSATRNGMADAFIYLNALVIVAWFVRLLVVFSHYIRSWSDRSSFIEEMRQNDDSLAKHTDRESDGYADLSTSRFVQQSASTGPTPL